MIKDSGNRTKFDSGAVRDIQEGKGRCDLLPLVEVGEWVEPEHPLNIFTMVNEYRKSPSVNKMRLILDTFAADKDIADLEDLKKSRYELVLEVSKHFEEGAKKYGDRNWEKGIPCDRYIDSAIRHYLKWRAGWTDEPHDRAFMWNILCCEWTRQRYGWNLERLDKTGEQIAKCIQDGLKMASSLYDKESAEKIRWACSQLTETETPLKQYDNIRLNDSTEFTMAVEGDLSGLLKLVGIEKPKDQETEDLKAACDVVKRHNTCLNENCIDRSCSECKYYTDPDTVQKAVDVLLDHAEKSLNGREQEKPKKRDQDSAELKEACDVVELYNTCYNAPTAVCLHKNCSECEHHVDDCDLHKAVIQLYDYVKTSLNGGEKVVNLYIRNVTGGVELYDYAGNYVGYVHGFIVSEKDEHIIRSIVQKCWGLLTFNPHTLEKIIEDHGYISDVHFLVELYKDPGNIKLPDDWQLAKGAQDGIRLNDFEEAKKKDQDTGDLKKACDVAKRYNACRTTPTDICFTRSCRDCEYNTDTEEVTEALNKMANYIKKSEGSKK